ncbi:hypothetical protein [Thermoflexus sp.]|uniref:hypothetical protein n=1 Tax=Thermoflexus sp. TaxID=1969742 RepID=UPI0025EA38E5|nr:hypothetical protein [Thermoflexus sp.]MDW8180886.1 hypothetical protein [Anaerolineae bacterium]MCS6962737.1 hypothetical protein [Thermoflexus sp.]MCS7351429.1 hypothetical protein [Thermoflexus sp.]MCX7690020.1 hypothetical protein [Thermoflexus sp.]MDW8184055.1 hypothetical protein [Anaerolineae bacterium]
MSLRKASVLELATAAYELEARVLRGPLRRDADGRWWVGETSVEEWLSAYEGHEAVLILASLSEETPVAPRVCRTCGREYVGWDCPHCREVRRRLRGR